MRHFFLKAKFVHVLLVCVIMVAGLSGFFCAQEVQAYDNVQISINGNIVQSDVPPIIMNSRILVPIRVVSEYLGAQVVWHQETLTAVIVKDGNVLTLNNNTNSYILNGEQKSSDVSISIINNRFMVPLRVVAESLGAKVDWDDANRKVIISASGVSNKPDAPAPSDNASKVIKVMQVDGNIVNLRQGPGIDFPVIGRVQSNDLLQVLGQSGEWYKIKTASNDDAYIAKWLVEDYNGTANQPSVPEANQPSTPTPAPAPSVKGNGMSVTAKKQDKGQSSISFDIKNATPHVVSNKGNKIVIQIDGIQAGNTLGNPVGTMSPFTSFNVENISDNSVRITTTVTEHGYFRLDWNHNIFSVMAVAKHKNGQIGLSGKTIVISPGHGVYGNDGAIDRGARSKYNGLDEVTFNTPVALQLRDKLEAAGATVIMIRDTEGPVNVSLYERAAIANRNNADAFVSIHADSAANTSARGIGTWLFTGDLRLTSAAQKDIRNEFARVMNTALANTTGQPAYIKYANFAVTRESEMPCVLIESGYLSNPEDAALLATPQYQSTMAQAIFNGLNNYFSY